MTAVAPLRCWVARAIVVEQLNPDQWHAVTRGWAVAEGSWEDRGSGVNDFNTVVADALEKAECTGLPVLVHAYQDTVRPLCEVAP